MIFNAGFDVSYGLKLADWPMRGEHYKKNHQQNLASWLIRWRSAKEVTEKARIDANIFSGYEPEGEVPSTLLPGT